MGRRKVVAAGGRAVTEAARRRRLARLADEAGIMRVLAIDHRDSLRVMIEGGGSGGAAARSLCAVKADLVAATGGLATGVMLDPEIGMDESVVRAVPTSVGIIAAREAQGYLADASVEHTTLMDGWDARAASAGGADAVKLLALWDGSPSAEQRAVIAAAIDEAHAAGLPLVLEPLPRGGLPATGAWVRGWVDHHADTGADVFKLPYPGSSIECARVTESIEAPWALLSAGAEFDVFVEQLTEALAAGVAGYIVGRAVWREAATLDPAERRQAIRTHVLPRLHILAGLAAG
jgi:tagatose 1,6-diphosphate aldolase